jgi:hypothetical protein
MLTCGVGTGRLVAVRRISGIIHMDGMISTNVGSMSIMLDVLAGMQPGIGNEISSINSFLRSTALMLLTGMERLCGRHYRRRHRSNETTVVAFRS